MTKKKTTKDDISRAIIKDMMERKEGEEFLINDKTTTMVHDSISDDIVKRLLDEYRPSVKAFMESLNNDK